MASIKDKIRKLVKEELTKVLEGTMDGENFSRMDALQGSNAMEKAFAAVGLDTLMSIALPYLNDDEKEILKDEMLKIVMVMPDAELEEIYDTVVASATGQFNEGAAEQSAMEHQNKKIKDMVEKALGLRDPEEVPDAEWDDSPESDFADAAHMEDPQFNEKLNQYLLTKGTSLKKLGIRL